MTLSSSLGRFFGNEWTPVVSASMPHGRRRYCACPSPDQNRHFMFGELDTNGFYGAVLEYNAALKNFATHTPIPRARTNFAATAIDDHRFLVVGGFPAHKSCYVYDTRTKEWSDDWPDLNIGRTSHACVTTNNKVYAIGGGGHRERRAPIDSIEELDLSLPTPRWRILPQRLKIKRYGCRAVVDPKDPNTVIVVGGFNTERETVTSCETVSLEEDQEGRTRTIPSLTTPRFSFSMIVVEKRFLVAIGGSRTTGLSHSWASVEVLDLYEAPQEQRWRALPSIKTGRQCYCAFYSPNDCKIVVVGGFDERYKTLDTVEELQVHGFVQRAPLPHEGLGRDQDGGMSNQPPYQPLGKPPPLTELPTGCLDTTHQGRIEQWLIASEEQMTTFVAQVDARERELVHERDGNRRIRDEYVAQVNKSQGHGRAILAYIQDKGTTGNGEPNQKQTSIAAGMAGDDGAAVPPHHPLGKAPPLKELQMDVRSRRQMEMWIKENEKHKNEFVSAFETREEELLEEMNENRRVCNVYVEHVRRGQRKAKAMVRLAVSEGVPHELLCPITHELMVDPVMTADGHTYERAAIELVFEGTEDVRSPVTGLVLSSRLLTPNVAIRSMCKDYVEDTSS